MIMISLLLVKYHTEGMGPDQTVFLTFLPALLWLLLCMFGCSNSVQLTLSSFSVMVTLYLLVVQVSVWKVNSVSTYSTILTLRLHLKDFQAIHSLLCLKIILWK